MTPREARLDALLADLTLAAVNACRGRADAAARGELRRQVERVRAWRDGEAAERRLAVLEGEPRPEPDPSPTRERASTPGSRPGQALPQGEGETAPDAWKARAPYKED